MQVNKYNSPILKLAREHRYLAYFERGDCLVNLAGDYDYLELPYYVSQDLESEGKKVQPTCREMLDAYVPPVFLEKAKLSGLAVPEHYISNGYFEPPVIIDPINPFMFRSRTVRKAGREESTAKSMTRNFKYAVCCQEIPAGAQIRYFRSVLGWCVSDRFQEVSRAVWEVFHIPLARVRVMLLDSGDILLSDIAPLLFENLRKRELSFIERRVRWEE
ncbi:MAG: RimK-like ATPgrasp N-terminal domain-containing protein [Candidatus Zixiibacteriota bacterium]|nr:MAG: RimK-like ATPgrasp N-terminal domain-containing protein [candidate division Zixibacteria bacterium]